MASLVALGEKLWASTLDEGRSARRSRRGEAANRRWTDAQVLEDAERLIAAWRALSQANFDADISTFINHVRG